MNEPKLALYVPVFPQYSETFIFNKFNGLLKNKVNAYLICDYSPPKNWTLFQNQLNLTQFKKNIFKGFIQRPQVVASIISVFIIPLLFIKRPYVLFKAILILKANNNFTAILKRIYQDFWFIWLKPSHIHFEFGNHFLDRIYLKKIWDAKIICSFRGYDLNYLGLGIDNFYQPVWKHCDFYHFLGNDLYKRALSRGFPANKQYILIPPSIDANLFKSKINKKNLSKFSENAPLKMITVSRLDWKKGYEWALAGLPKLVQTNIHFSYTIVGDGPMYEALCFAIHALKLKDKVNLIGKVPPYTIPELLENSHLYIQPSVSEGFCNAVLEAQSMELPVIASDADGLPENIEDGKTGFIVQRRNSAAMAEKIAWFYHHPEEIPVYGKRGRERVLAHFTLEQQAEKFDKWYKEILS